MEEDEEKEEEKEEEEEVDEGVGQLRWQNFDFL